MGTRTLDFPSGKGNNYHIAIYVPSTKNISQKISKKQFQRRIRDVVKFMRQTLGGSTRIAGIGNYYSDELGQSVTETIAKIESYTTQKSYLRYDEVIEKYLKQKKKEWSQESLSYQFNGSLYFI